MLTIRRCADATPIFEYTGDSWDGCIAAARKDKVSLRAADFSGAQLRYVNFSDMALTSACFIGAELSHAKFMDADLSHSTLSRAGLCSARLDNANLHMASCRAAIMDRAGLNGASFTSADLANVSLLGARCVGTDFTGADLRGARFAPALHWDLAQVTSEQLSHYRDDLWMLLCELPELAEPLRVDANGICALYTGSTILSIARWSNLYELATELLPALGSRQPAVYRIIGERKVAREWFRQFHESRPCEIFRRTGEWVAAWQASMRGLATTHFQHALAAASSPAAPTRPHPRNIRTE